jgi:two-component system cell cycle response regulator DivK
MFNNGKHNPNDKEINNMPKTIMVVDDYADARTMMRTIIEWYGYDVVEAADGYEAIEKTIQHHPDLILMDLALPILDGVTATKLIREIEGFDKVSIVALTGFGNTSFEKAIEAGFDNVFVKPIHFENIEPLLNQYLA